MTRILITLALASQAGAQSVPQFEVATVKAAKSDAGVQGGCHGIDSHFSPLEAAHVPPLGRCVITNGRLAHFISTAYQLHSTALIKSAPDWIARGFDRYNIEAKAEDPAKTTEAELLQMLQNLLIERFDLKFHRENIERPGFALVAGKNGSKLKLSTAGEAALNFGPGQEKPMPNSPISMRVRKCSMETLATMLSQLGSGPVLDKTGLKGEYDFVLSWDDSAGPSLSTALQEQLGLRLESQKVPVSFFVVDSAKKPTL